MVEAVDFRDIWLNSEIESGYGIDELAVSNVRLGLFIRAIEVSILSSFPRLKLPALQHLRLVLALAVLPNGLTVSGDSNLSNVGGLKSLLFTGLLSDGSIKLLELITNWNFHDDISEMNNQDDEGKYFQYQQIKSLFLPLEVTSNEQRKSSRSNTRVNYYLPVVSPAKRPQDEEGEDPSVEYSSDRRKRGKSGPVESPLIDEEEITVAPQYQLDTSEYMAKGIFCDVKSIWDMIGWAFTCSTVDDIRYRRRWDQWKKFLTFLFNFLQKDDQYENETNSFDSIVRAWVNPIINSSIFDAIFATVQAGGAVKYNAIFPNEIPSDVNESDRKYSSTGKIILKPIEYNNPSLQLRSILLKLVLKQKDPQQLHEILNTISQAFLQESWIYSCLFGTLFNYRNSTGDFSTITPTSCIPSNLILRLGWSSNLPDSLLTESWYQFIYEDSNTIPHDLLIDLLHTIPGKTIITNEFDSLWSIYCLIINSLNTFTTKRSKTQYSTAFQKGHANRISWIQERYDKNHIKCDKKIITDFISRLNEVSYTIQTILNKL